MIVTQKEAPAPSSLDWIYSFVGGVAVALFLVTTATMWRNGAATNEFPAYLEAIATSGALLAASAAAVFAYRAFNLERRRDIDRESEAERNHQASQVAAWQPAKEPHGYLINNSELPIRTERITFVVPFSGERYTYTHEKGDKVPNRGLFEKGKHPLPWPAELPATDLFGGMSPRDDHNDYLAVEVRFRDTRGVIWLLDDHGFLSKQGVRKPEDWARP